MTMLVLRNIASVAFLCSFMTTFTSCEVYTALADLEELLSTEAALVDTLERYIQAQDEKLNLLKRYSFAYQSQHDKASEDMQMYVSNPINAYLLVKRLTTDWKDVESLMQVNAGQEFIANLTLYREHMPFPTDEDLNGAAVALTRLQDTYRLDTAALARGELNGVKYSAGLNADDCFELGRQSYNNEDYYHTQLWMKETDVRLVAEESGNSGGDGSSRNGTNGGGTKVKRPDVLEYLAFSTFKQGNVVLALDLTNKLLEMSPSHSRALGNKVYYEDAIRKTERVKRKGEDENAELEAAKTLLEPKHLDYMEPEGRLHYEQLCRGEISTPIEITSKLTCYYEDNNIPFLKIAPFKVEEAYPNPRIVLFHDVMTDDEIATIKKLAQPRFKRATVQNSQTGALETAQYRISKSAWLREHEHRHVAAVCQRVADMTTLNQETAEELQVVNYGIGGHYEPHYDFARKDEKNAFRSLGTGNRIATVLFYMSDVAQGGATVFPNLQTALWPRKGSAAFWYNLHSSGDGDSNTRHAACPVLAGSKWVSNKWLHERGQEFRRPCGLQPPPPELTA